MSVYRDICLPAIYSFTWNYVADKRQMYLNRHQHYDSASYTLLGRVTY